MNANFLFSCQAASLLIKFYGFPFSAQKREEKILWKNLEFLATLRNDHSFFSWPMPQDYSACFHQLRRYNPTLDPPYVAKVSLRFLNIAHFLVSLPLSSCNIAKAPSIQSKSRLEIFPYELKMSWLRLGFEPQKLSCETTLLTAMQVNK